MKRRLSFAAALVALAAGATGALAGSAETPGVTATQILIGGTAPISGEASSAKAVADGAAAYFKYVGAKINGRSVDYKYLDDGYDPSQTVQDVRQLVEQDGVFAIYNTLGTNNNLAIRDYLNQQQVPQLFVASGANTWGADYKKYPWTIGFIPSYVLEGRVLGRYIVKTRPKAKIGVLFQDDAYGHDLVSGLKKGLGKKAGQIVSQVGYDPSAADVSSQVAQIKASKADTFMIFAFGKFAIQAFVAANKLGWHPQVFVNAVASSASVMGIADLAAKAVTRGAISIVFGKDPSDPRWKKDKGLALERQILKKYGPAGADPKNGYYVAGMASAFTLVDTLRRAGKSLTRASVMKAATSLNERSNPFVLPGIVIKTTSSDHFPIEQVSLQRWTKGHWSIFGGLLTAKS
jgi:branched-chain amino acid transport system substrate-binding protein